jgi:hypothetical protein
MSKQLRQWGISSNIFFVRLEAAAVAVTTAQKEEESETSTGLVCRPFIHTVFSSFTVVKQHPMEHCS